MILIINKRLLKVLTFNRARAIALYPFVIVNSTGLTEDHTLLHHERIHLCQQLEMLIIPFYVWYLLEFLVRYIQYGSIDRAYRNISFEREAFQFQDENDYLTSRRIWAFLRFV